MTYIDLINRFWKIYQEDVFSSNEVHLYFFLLNEYNLKGRQNPFEYPNRRIVLATGMSEKTVIEVRNRLQQKGLFQFESGRRNAKSPVYYFPDESKMESKTESKKVSKEESKKVSLNKENKREENINIPPTPPKGEGINKKARSLFEDYFNDTFSSSYYWTAKDAGNMKQLLQKITFSREQKKMPIDDDSMMYALKSLLSSINEGWIFENFSVANINSKYNEIVSQAKNGKTNRNTRSDKQEANEYAMQVLTERLKQREQGISSEIPKPF